MKVLEATEKRPGKLEQLFKALLSIPPRSVKPERAFNHAADIIFVKAPCLVFFPNKWSNSPADGEVYKYHGITFSSDGRQDNKLNTRIGKTSAAMRQLYQLVVLK